MRKLLDNVGKHFHKGGKLERYYAVYEMIDTFLYTPSDVTKGKTHVRDGIDLKRTMVTVAMALVPVILFAMYNTGLQANLILAGKGLTQLDTWRGDILANIGLGLDPHNIFACFVHGALYFIPVFLVTNIVGGFWEALFATIRGHEINEGFLVTGILFPLTLPPTIPLWQVAVGISFGVVIGKEVFGGTGKNFLNPALTARAFLFFAYPAQISGDAVWTAVDGFTGATHLAQAALLGPQALTDWWSAFYGFIPGSMGETSALACLIGAFALVFSGIGSWRIMLSMVFGAVALATVFNMVGSETNPMFAVTPAWHLVLGSFAFGCVFMATDPVSAAMTYKGQYLYGILVGMMVILIRVVNPAYPEGTMLAILFGNIFAPLFDYFVIKANIKKRMKGYV
jgi:Na+-transporting NADH:ubiquinone oxidoreductase subunit B